MTASIARQIPAAKALVGNAAFDGHGIRIHRQADGFDGHRHGLPNWPSSQCRHRELQIYLHLAGFCYSPAIAELNHNDGHHADQRHKESQSIVAIDPQINEAWLLAPQQGGPMGLTTQQLLSPSEQLRLSF